jgi:hypothetical protein
VSIARAMDDPKSLDGISRDDALSLLDFVRPLPQVAIFIDAKARITYSRVPIKSFLPLGNRPDPSTPNTAILP